MEWLSSAWSDFWYLLWLGRFGFMLVVLAVGALLAFVLFVNKLANTKPDRPADDITGWPPEDGVDLGCCRDDD